MGLLDDAIREHLELKRRRGADPGEVAREQQEALSASGAPAGADDERAIASAEHFPEDPELKEAQAKASHEVQETEELDMKPLLEGTEPVAIPDERDASGDFMGAAGDALEWRSPQEDAAGASSRPGSQRAGGQAPRTDEDVLEETPEFLRETPDQERLWFEQRPPRDFDFDS